MGEFLFNLDVEKGYHFNMQLKKKNDNFYYIKSFSNFYMERNTKKKKKSQTQYRDWEKNICNVYHRYKTNIPNYKELLNIEGERLKTQ